MSNLRIKNKKLKRELDLLKNQNIQYEDAYERANVITLVSKHICSEIEFELMPRKNVYKEAVSILSDQLLPYVKFNSYKDRDTGIYVIESRLDVFDY